MKLSGELASLAEIVVLEAAPRLLELRKSASAKSWKAQTDFRTEADLEIEGLVVSSMLRKHPQLAIYSEESGVMGGSSALKLILDPIDGTIIWSSGLADYYSIAAAFTANETVQSSLIYFPHTASLFVAVRGGGAWERVGETWCRLMVSSETCFQHATIAVDHGKEKRETAPPIMLRLLHPTAGVTCVPQLLCSSYSLVQVAKGGLHGYVSVSAPCEDALPGMLIAKEAGAVVGTINADREWSEEDRSLVVACTSEIYSGLKACL